MVKSTLSPKEIDSAGDVLEDSRQTMGLRFRALFTLKNVGGQQAIERIGSVLFKDSSALLKHECAYCLGQMQDQLAIDVLAQVLANVSEHPMVRHEAGEALGAIGSERCLNILQNYIKDPSIDVAQTAQLAVNRIKYYQNIKPGQNEDGGSSLYSSVDPAPPLNSYSKEKIEQLKNIMIDEKESLFKRYQAMFTLRNINTDESALALASGLDCQDSALFRHEIAFVLGQMQKSVTIKKLAEILARKTENEMVRHECAEALGSIATKETDQILKNYLSDEAQVVRESAIVALDVSDYNNSKQFQFLDNL